MSKENNEDHDAEEEATNYNLNTTLITIKENNAEDAIETPLNNPICKSHVGSMADNSIKGNKPKLEQAAEMKDKLRKLASNSLELKSIDWLNNA